jgi:hypothetical protein
MHAAEQSDIGVVPEKGPNKTAFFHAVAEAPEGRPVTKEKFWIVVCDLYAETGESIERT